MTYLEATRAVQRACAAHWAAVRDRRTTLDDCLKTYTIRAEALDRRHAINPRRDAVRASVDYRRLTHAP